MNLLRTIILVSISSLSMMSNAPTEITKPSKTSGYAPVNGLRMYYEVYGTGEIPLVLIHGGGSTIETTFANIIPRLPTRRKLIAVELQAHGRTNDRNAPESFQQDADDVSALLGYLKIAKADLLGFSNGGSTSMQIAIRHPEVVNKMIVIAGASKREGFIPGFFEFMAKGKLADMPAPLMVSYLELAPDKDGLQVMFERDKQRMISFKDWSDDDMRSIKAPAFFIVADHDVITIEHTLKMSRLVSNGQLVVLPGTHGSSIGEVVTFKSGSKLLDATVMLIEEFLSE